MTFERAANSLKATPQQSLANIQADAIEGLINNVDIGHYVCSNTPMIPFDEIQSYADQLRERVNG